MVPISELIFAAGTGRLMVFLRTPWRVRYETNTGASRRLLTADDGGTFERPSFDSDVHGLEDSHRQSPEV